MYFPPHIKCRSIHIEGNRSRLFKYFKNSVLSLVRVFPARLCRSLTCDMSRPTSIEKASIDESYLDLSQTVRNVILARYPVLASLPAGRTAESPLPSPAEIGITIDWPAFGNIIPINPVVHTIVAEGETSRGIEQVPVFENYGELTWGDVALSIGADIVRTCRSTVESKLGYTCSAGIAPNKVGCDIVLT